MSILFHACTLFLVACCLPVLGCKPQQREVTTHQYPESWSKLIEQEADDGIGRPWSILAWKGLPHELRTELWQPRDGRECYMSAFFLWSNEPWKMAIVHTDLNDDGRIDSMHFSMGTGKYSYRDYNLDGMLDVMVVNEAKATYILYENAWTKTLEDLGMNDRDAQVSLDDRTVSMSFENGRWGKQGQPTSSSDENDKVP